jgi:hypothetical protein
VRFVQRTAESFFAVRPIKDARQRFKRTAKAAFLEFHGHYSKYRWEILSSPRTVRLQTLTSGPVSWATMVSEPGSPLLGVGSAVIFFILAADADAWVCHNFFE